MDRLGWESSFMRPLWAVLLLPGLPGLLVLLLLQWAADADGLGLEKDERAGGGLVLRVRRSEERRVGKECQP